MSDITYVPPRSRCRCQHCDGTLEFDVRQGGEIVVCPNCQMETMLFVPQVPRASSPSQSGVAAEALPPHSIGQRAALIFMVVVLSTVSTVAVLAEEEPNYGVLAGGAAALFGSVIYFVPAMIAVRKRNFRAIFILNIALGWTLLGWIGALVWASLKEKAE